MGTGNQSSQSIVILYCPFSAVSDVVLLSLAVSTPLPRPNPTSSYLSCSVSHDWQCSVLSSWSKQSRDAPLISPLAHLEMKPCSFTHLLPSTSECDKKPIWLIRYENPGYRKPIMIVDWLPNTDSEIAVTRKGMWSQQVQTSV